MTADKSEVKAVLEVLGNEKYKWRTIDGVSQETALPAEKVIDVLRSSDEIVKSSIPSPDGRSLYTTREHFRKSASAFERVLSVIKNRST